MGWIAGQQRRADHQHGGQLPALCRLFRVHADGSGVPEPLPLPSGIEGSFSPDGQSLAYQPITKWQRAWKRYVGGQTTPIWIVNLKTLELKKVPRENSNDSNPVWVGDQVYFLSDRYGDGKNTGPVTLYRYDTKSGQVSQVMANNGLDMKSFQAGPATGIGRVEPERLGGGAVWPHSSGRPGHRHEYADPDFDSRRAGQSRAPPGQSFPGGDSERPAFAHRRARRL